ETMDPAESLIALRGSSLRSETYRHDGTSKAHLPLTVDEKSYDVKLLPPRRSNKYSVVQLTPRETLATQYESDTADPRVTHEVVLKTNAYGDVEESLQIVYPRTEEKQTGLVDVDENQKAGNMALTRT